MKIYFYTHPYDGGESKQIRRGLMRAEIDYVEINPFCNVQNNRQLVHKLSAVPCCVIVDLDGNELARQTHRKGKTDLQDMLDFLASDELKTLTCNCIDDEMILLEQERQVAVSLGLSAAAARRQADIDALTVKKDKIKPPKGLAT